LTYTGALGYVTELLSGEFNAPFGRSSHHQVWSEAMVITPLIRGLLGIEAKAGGQELWFSPQLPANWNQVEARNLPVGEAIFDLKAKREPQNLTVTINRAGSSPAKNHKFVLAPAFPLDARIREVKVQGRPTKFETRVTGDVQRVEISLTADQPTVNIVYLYDDGTEVFAHPEKLTPGARNKGLRILRSRSAANSMQLLLEGLGGNSYGLHIRSPKQIGVITGATKESSTGDVTRLVVPFDGPPGKYVRKELTVPLMQLRK
jgi:hypothetical protein